MTSSSPESLTRLSDIPPGESWIMMLYGASKTGKTFFAGTAGSRTLYINIGAGLETLRSPLFMQRHPNSEGMIVMDVRETNPSGTAEAFENTVKFINMGLEKFSDQWDTVVIDEATALRRFALNKAMEINSAARKSNRRDNSIESFVVPEIGDYGVEMQMIEWFLSTLIPLLKQEKKHLIMLAHERQVFGKPSKIGDEAPLKKVMPGFTGKTFPDKVPAYFDDVWRSEVVGGEGNTIYRVRTAGTESRVGGSRHGGIFKTTETNPNFLEMLARIRNSTKR